MKETVYLGIDVSKGYADFILVNKDQDTLEPVFQLNDNVQGHESLKTVLSRFIESHPETKICCGLESTGGYERNWYRYLLSLSEEYPIKVALLNPVVVKGISKASLNRTITDGVSAMNIASYLVSYHNKVNYRQGQQDEESFESGRSLYAYQKMLNKQKTQLNNQLERILYQNFPEVLSLCRNGIPAWVLKALTKYSTPEKITNAGIEKLSRIKGIGNKLAGKIVEKANQNQQKPNKQIGFIIKNMASQIQHKEKEIAKTKTFLANTYQEHPQVKLLTSITGIGNSSAIAILFEIGDIERFKSAKSMAAYFGVHPEFKQSGDGKWKSHMAKKGRKAMRSVLYMACFTAFNQDPVMKKKYADIRAKGKNHYFAMGVLMHKMLRIIYGILKSGVPYNPEIDQRNQEKAAEKQANIEEKEKQQAKENLSKKRRFQQINTDDSPISNRKVKKIKELESS